jgi:hypothetical protein
MLTLRHKFTTNIHVLIEGFGAFKKAPTGEDRRALLTIFSPNRKWGLRFSLSRDSTTVVHKPNPVVRNLLISFDLRQSSALNVKGEMLRIVSSTLSGRNAGGAARCGRAPGRTAERRDWTAP